MIIIPEIYQDFLIQDPGTILPTSQTSTEMPGYEHIDSLPVQRSQKSHHSLKGAQSARKKKNKQTLKFNSLEFKKKS